MVAVGGVGIGLRKAWTWDGAGVISRVSVGLVVGRGGRSTASHRLSPSSRDTADTNNAGVHCRPGCQT